MSDAPEHAPNSGLEPDATDEADNLTRAGAVQLAARLDAYWRAQGATTVRHWAVAAPGRHGSAPGIYVVRSNLVRSNLVRGQPPR